MRIKIVTFLIFIFLTIGYVLPQSLHVGDKARLEHAQGVINAKDNGNNEPDKYNLAQNYPNPFNPTTSISFTIEKTSFTQLTIYNSIGEQVTTLVSKTLTPGTYSFTWNADNMSSGIYFYRLASGNFIDVKKMTLLK